ncbi:DUF389 domain-containing protein [Leptospira fletcheri]|uniref:DUF389 domain-containing protein n=1 Tax=Leptospira fletcheri TaxID=2484981 RepID=A0A4V3JDS5_9LEPT|nr:DUF389 domain-containing protein [Leptospira fletcheri]TGK11875.1 DUF389 domain-containing protein [Leptospira fletcheri]
MPISKKQGSTGTHDSTDLSRNRKSISLSVTTESGVSLFRRLLKIGEEEAIFALREIDEGAQIQSVRYWVILTASSGIATIGILIGSPLILGCAMILSPLLKPVIGIGAGFAVGDVYLSIKSLLNLFLSSILTILVAILLSKMAPVRELSPEVLSRVSPGGFYLIISAFCGPLIVISGFGSAKEHYRVGIGTVLGVSLLPPLCIFGLAVERSLRWDIQQGLLLSFLANLSLIVVTSAACFYIIFEKYDIPNLIHLLSSHRQKNEHLYQFVSDFRIWQKFESRFSLENRIMFPSLLIFLFSVPIFSSFFLLKQKSNIREFIDSKLSVLGEIHYIRGSETLIFTGSTVSGTLVFYSNKSPDGGLTKSLNEELTSGFPGISFTIQLARIQRETDLHSSKLSDFTEADVLEKPDPTD